MRKGSTRSDPKLFEGKTMRQGCDQNVLLAAISSNGDMIMSSVKDHAEKGIIHTDKQVKKESDARKKAVKNIRAKYDARFKTQAKIQADEMIAMNQKNAALEARLAALEAGCVSDKKARTVSNVVANHKKHTFGWKKMRHGVTDSVVGFATVEEAQADMARFYGAAVVGVGI